MTLVTYKTASIVLGWPKEKVYLRAKEGRIPAHKADGVWIFIVEELYEFIRTNQCQFSKEKCDIALSQKQA